ncbi:HD-GYP domain-containing protein [Paenibacillus thalictri]|uniref:HD-GYP domain-containing protein n=1 Tax=Paenibacillus thalictri TaxID=2527873 RepID=A0A4Q9DHX9_9BACL|nr:HD-GYP domain-containing protein [Paenibacillus thalictri]TBL72676.1 HD-GYP domain-containing protein [Paenibacillus thalictri]
MMEGRTLRQWIGYTIKRDLFNERGVVLIPAKTIIDNHHVEMIENHRISLSVHDFELDKQELAPRESKTNDKLVVKAMEEVKSMFHFLSEKGTLPVEEINQSIIPAIHQAAEYPSLQSVMSGLQAKDDYTYRHNIGVGVISTLIGKWLHLSESELALLTMAATLHDIGKIHISDYILNKPGRYTDEEYAVMKKHTVIGYDLLCQIPGLDARVPLVALQHHEREDGGGYPYRLKAHEIDFFSKIVGVADIFHAMTSKRVYKDASPFHLVIKQMLDDGFGKLEPSICKLFIHRLMEMAVGDEAILTDGRRCQIVGMNPLDVANPLIRVDGKYVDLSKSRELHILALVG